MERTIAIVFCTWFIGFLVGGGLYIDNTPASMMRGTELAYVSVFWWIALPIFIAKSLVLGIYDQVKSR